MNIDQLEATIFALNNINNLCNSIEVLKEAKSFGHATGLALIGWEEFVRAMNFYILACSKNLNPVEEKKILNNIEKIGTGNLASKIDESLEIGMQIVLTRWLQAKPESFEILINYLTAQTEFEKNTFLDAMLEYLKGDTSNFAITFRQLLDLTKEIKIFSKIKKETYLYVNKNNSAPITSTDETLSTYFDHLLKIKAFSESIIDFIKELFMKKELFEKYVKFDNNVRLIWPNIYKGFG